MRQFSLKGNCLISCLALWMALIQVACSAQSTVDLAQAPQQARQEQVSEKFSIVTYADDQAGLFEVTAWVDKPNPYQGEQVILIGNLKMNGVFLGGIMMEAFWPDKDLESGVPNCFVLVIYQRGVCSIDTKDFPVGEYVPVTVKFVYNDHKYLGETGFTPR